MFLVLSIKKEDFSLVKTISDEIFLYNFWEWRIKYLMYVCMYVCSC